ncbi:methyltransferase domain-containing protein [Ramlibacter algicola]|uniref:Methyltransferase domain-containing protein n=1 Tax=Ramlibacter algicola TaxID=2795217 RepID=A0A934Q4E5_9BURK|nr:methyltransferase domain-containing protein [Ramlibacter algicola]
MAADTGAARPDPADVAGRVRAAPRADAHLVNQYYTLCIPFYREFLGDHWHTGWYDAQAPIGPNDQLRMEAVIARSARLGPGSEVLDVGCGVGGPACHLAATTGARVRGLTPNDDQLAIARASAARRQLQDRVQFDLGDAGRLPYPDASFDAVLFFESACHFPDRERFFAEAWRVLRPGGRLAGEDWVAGTAVPVPQQKHWNRLIATTWAIPELDTIHGYVQGMQRAGFADVAGRDLREETALLRGFLVDPQVRRQVEAERAAEPDPVRALIMEGLLVLGEAASLGAFTVGRFLAHKPA